MEPICLETGFQRIKDNKFISVLYLLLMLNLENKTMYSPKTKQKIY